MDQVIRQQESFVAALRQRTPSKLAARLLSAYG